MAGQKTPFTFTLVALLTFFTTTTLAYNLCELAQYPNGTFYIANPNSLQCRICGFEEGAEPIRCLAFNDTFDGMKPGANIKPAYSRAQYTGLHVAAPSSLDPIQPASHMRYAKSNSSGIAVMDFLGLPPRETVDFWNFGTLYSFSYACANASTIVSYVNEAIACTVNVTSNCADVDYGTGDQLTLNDSIIYDYEPVDGGNGWAAMQSGSWSPPPPNNTEFANELCSGYTFTATASDGTPALLYLDNILYNGWWNWE